MNTVYIIYDHRLLRATLIRKNKKTSTVKIPAYGGIPSFEGRIDHDRIADPKESVQVLFTSNQKMYFLRTGDQKDPKHGPLWHDSGNWDAVENHWRRHGHA